MPATRPPRGLLMALAAIVGVLALTGSAVAWGVTARPSSERVLAVAGAVQAEPPAPSTTTSSTTTSTSTTTPTTTSTSTTVKPKPVDTTVPTTRAPRPTAPPTTAAAAPAPQPTVSQQTWGSSPEQRCASVLQWVAGQGLKLPAGWGYRCPAKAIVDGAEKWGLACWNCEGSGSWIAVDIGRVGPSDAALRYVVAHEICHAIDYMTLGASSEIGADLCAALHGAPRP